ncbi:immunity 22 family protein [Paenibacillus peoriae]|uniref:immunity 22 family protein n=1 Tax=Paenibacillus peoriae TaxID=59893 RepID=UPI00208F3249|nr:immunity 22 family protein [Paenibacillus peoriae]
MVSVWYGHFASEDELFEYVEIKYPEDENEDVFSGFLNDQEIDDFDEDFAEGVFQVDGTDDGIKDVSYVDSFLSPLLHDLSKIDGKYNSLFFIYDCNTSGLLEKSGVKLCFLAVYPYTRD